MDLWHVIIVNGGMKVKTCAALKSALEIRIHIISFDGIAIIQDAFGFPASANRSFPAIG